MNAKTWLVLGACLGGLAVVLGAFGAHGLRERYFPALDIRGDEIARRLETWEIAVRYHMYHALALLLVGALVDRKNLWSLHGAGLAFFFGILIFSGCLYALALTGTKVLGAIVPVGGVLFIVGWVLLALAANQFASATPKEESASPNVAATEPNTEVPRDVPSAGDDAPSR